MVRDYADRVRAGIKFLDSKASSGLVPVDWREKVDLDGLALQSCDVCVLGQLFGSYSTGKDVLGIDSDESMVLGFSTDFSFDELTQAWKDALGANRMLVEKGDVYKDEYSCAVKVLQTHIVKIDGTAKTVYLVRPGSVVGNSFMEYSGGVIHALRKSDFEQTYNIKVEAFVPKKGMFITSTVTGKNYYVCSDDEVRELKDRAYAEWISDLPEAERNSFTEMRTGMGERFSDTIIK